MVQAVFRKGSSLDHTLKLKGSDPTVDHAQGTHYPVSYFSDWPFFVPPVQVQSPPPRAYEAFLRRDSRGEDDFSIFNPTKTPKRPGTSGSGLLSVAK